MSTRSMYHRDVVAPVSLFYLYAQEDEPLRQQLEKQLALLRRQGLISDWHEGHIDAGMEWEQEIEDHLATASVILLLISPDFIASDYCYDLAMKHALERHKRGEASVIPIILRPCDWLSTPFKQLRCLPRSGIAITRCPDRDEAFHEVTQDLRKIIKAKTHPIPIPPGEPSVPGGQGTDIIQPGSSLLPSPPASINPLRPNPLTRLKQRPLLLTIALIVLIALLLSGGLLVWHPWWSNSNGIYVTTAPDGEPIGISDGNFAFDTNPHRLDINLKQQAADKFNSGNTAEAASLWQQAVSIDTNDAEALIYLEDQRVIASGQPYITFVVGTMLTGQDYTIGQDDLQGAYVAQKEYNDGFKLPNGVGVRLLIASSGNKPEYAMMVAKQIVQAAKADRSIVGVMGWPFSARSLQAVPILVHAPVPIPVVSETASTDDLTGISPYFFRVVPPNKIQVIPAVNYAEQTLHATHAVVFVGYTDLSKGIKDPYSGNLAQDFEAQFHKDGNTFIEERYTVGNPSMGPLILNVERQTPVPDLIYFPGYAKDACPLLSALPTSGPFATIPILGGEALNEQGGYSDSCKAQGIHLHFTGYAYYDEWPQLNLAQQTPQFFTDYPNYFDPNRQHIANSYGYTRADNDPMLAYDAMSVLLRGSSIALSGGRQRFSPDDLQKALAGINDTHPCQGVSGRIAFGGDGDPIGKAILLLHVDDKHHITLDGQVGGTPLKQASYPPGCYEPLLSTS